MHAAARCPLPAQATDPERPLNPRFMEPLPKIAFGVTKAETEREREARRSGRASKRDRDASSENYGDDVAVGMQFISDI